MLNRVLQIAWILAVGLLAMGSVLFLDTEDLPIVLASLAAKGLTFATGCLSVVLFILLFCWRMKIDPVRAFNTIEKEPRATAIFLGCLFLGVAFMAGQLLG